MDKWCYGFDQLAERVEEYPPARVSQITGVPAEKIEEASRMYATHQPGIVQSSPSTEQAPNSSQFILARFLLPAVTGNYDVPGGQYLMEAAISPMYGCRDEYNIYRDLGLRLGQEGFWTWETHEEAYEHRLLQMGLTFKLNFNSCKKYV